MRICKRSGAGVPVSEMILGHNVEMCLTTADGLLSDRIRNPKFVGPAHAMTGIAPEWQGTSCGRGAYELTPNGGLMGSEAQLIQISSAHGPPHLHQNKLRVRAGEELELEIWARAWHEPVTLRVELRTVSARIEPYSAGKILVDTSYYKRYTLPLQAGADDQEARLSLIIEGTGALWIDQVHLRPKDEPLLCKGIIDEMARMRIPTLRFPGGIIANCCNWRHGTGPVHLRPSALDAAFHQPWHLYYDFGLDEILQLSVEQGMVPALTVNVATGTPEDAGEMAAYCMDWYRKAGVTAPVIYWHIANHPYHFTTAHMTPEMYVDVLKTFVPRIKAACPDGRIVAVMSSGELAAETEKAPWREAMFSVADLIDLVEVQMYGCCDPTADAATQLKALADTLGSHEKALRTFIASCRERKVNWNIGIAEWNWWMQASHWDGRDFEEPPTVLHGLYIAGMIHRFAALAPDFEAAHFYNLVNCMGILNHVGADIDVTDSVRVFNLYREALPGQRVELDASDTPSSAEAVCLEGEDATWLFLVNRDAEASLQVSLSGFGEKIKEIAGLQGSTPTGGFTPISGTVDGAVLEVPSLSIVRVRIGQE